MTADGSLNFDTQVDTKGFEQGTKSVNSSLGAMKSAFGKAALAVAAAFSAKAVTDFGKAVVEASAEVNAAGSQFEQTFGQMQAQAQAAINGVAKSSGILETRLRGVGTSIYAFAKTAGMDSATALGMMQEALQVTADSAAYYDRSLEDTAESLKSFLKGNFENDAALGLSCTETTRNAAANKLYGKSFQQLSESQKQLTLLQMVKDANALSGAMGQAARESDGWENVTGNLKEAWKQLLAVVGQPVLIAATSVVKALTDELNKLAEYAKIASAALMDVFGMNLDSGSGMSGSTDDIAKESESAADSYGDMAESAKEAAEANENSLASFDKVNKLAGDEGDDVSSNDSSASAALPSVLPTAAMTIDVDTDDAVGKLKSFLKLFKDVFKSAKKYFKENFSGIFEGIFDGLSAEFAELKGTITRICSDLGTLAYPLKKYLGGDFTKYLQTAAFTVGQILTGLFDSFNTVFSDIWEVAAFPILSNFVNVGLPMITQFRTQMWRTLYTLFDSVKTIFDTAWNEGIKPILGAFSQVWCSVVNTMSDFWNKWGAPIFENIRTAIRNTSDTMLNVWESILKPLLDTALGLVDEVWSEHLQPLLANILDLVGEVVNSALTIYNKAILPTINWIVDKLSPVIVKIKKIIMRVTTTVLEGIIDSANNIVSKLKGVVEFVTKIFTRDWDGAWHTVKTIFKGVWDSFVGIAKIPINAVIDLINSLLGGIEGALNNAVDAINSISIELPEAVADVVGYDSLGFDLGYIDLPEIPHLAAGTVVPANYGEFMAVLGDNKREAEVVSPLSTIEQAVGNALSKYGGAGGDISVEIPIILSGKEIHKEVVKINKSQIRKTGKNPLAT